MSYAVHPERSEPIGHAQSMLCRPDGQHAVRLQQTVLYPIDELFSTLSTLGQDVTAGQERNASSKADQARQRLSFEGLELLPGRDIAGFVDEQVYSGRLDSKPAEAHPKGRYPHIPVLVYVNRCMPLRRVVLGTVDALSGKREDLDTHEDNH